jgi:hypothetical protein
MVDRTHRHSLADLDGLFASAGFPAGELGRPPQVEGENIVRTGWL